MLQGRVGVKEGREGRRTREVRFMWKERGGRESKERKRRRKE